MPRDHAVHETHLNRACKAKGKACTKKSRYCVGGQKKANEEQSRVAVFCYALAFDHMCKDWVVGGCMRRDERKKKRKKLIRGRCSVLDV